MAFIPTVNGVRVDLLYRNVTTSQVFNNSLYFLGGSSWDQTEMLALAAKIKTWVVASLIPIIDDAIEFFEVGVTDISSATGLAVSYTTGLPVAGSHNSPIMPANVTLAVTFATALRGRSYRGRNYWPCFGDDQVTQDHVENATITAIVAGYNALLAVDMSTANNAVWSVLSRFTNNGPRGAGVLTPVTAARVADNVVDTQRRRLQGHGS